MGIIGDYTGKYERSNLLPISLVSVLAIVVIIALFLGLRSSTAQL